MFEQVILKFKGNHLNLWVEHFAKKYYFTNEMLVLYNQITIKYFNYTDWLNNLIFLKLNIICFSLMF